MNHFTHAESDARYKAYGWNARICILTTSSAKNGLLKMYVRAVRAECIPTYTVAMAPFEDASLKTRE